MESDPIVEKIEYEMRRALNQVVTGREEIIQKGWTELVRLEQDCRCVPSCHCEDILRDVLNGKILNVDQVPRIMTWFSKYLTVPTSEVNPITNDVAEFLKLTKIEDMASLALILQMLLEYKAYMPQSTSHAKLCKEIVITLSTFPMPCDAKKISDFTDNTTKIQKFLRTICSVSKPVEKENLITCLTTLYKIISDTKQESSPALNAVLELVEPSFIPEAVQCILSDSLCHNELVQALKILCTWLSKWRGDQLHIWIKEFILGLEKKHKYSILLIATEATLDQMYMSLVLPVVRQNISAVVFDIIKKHSSQQLIHNIMKKTPILLTFLKKEVSESSKECIQNIVDVMKGIMLRLPTCELYEDLENSFPVPPRDSVARQISHEPVWLDETKEWMDEGEQWANKTKELEFVVDSSKSTSGKVGLSNLGNTCYMNSVLQALFMTRQFCQEVLQCKVSSEPNDQIILKKLQNLFALLQYSKRISLAPTEILLVSRPAYFLPGQQQDSSEFLCHLLDILHEQEKSGSINYGGSEAMVNLKSKGEEQVNDINSSGEESGSIKRWTTEEDLTGGIMLQRKTQSLADFTQGVDLGQTQQLSDSHSDSTDSGIQSVGGEEISTTTSLIHRSFGGESKITYQCAQCDTNSHNTDKFRDLQLCFPEEICENEEVSVQELINYYLTPEKLTGENKYRCDKCTKLCDAQRIIKILQAPAHLILILKHFRYDFESRLRTKLRHKVIYNEMIQLPVTTQTCTVAETYQLYAAVVHSGYSMDYGHYFTYARDSKSNWYKFNDSYVSLTKLDDLKNLKPPDTPYILFYEKSTLSDAIDEEDKPEISTLSKHLQDLVEHDTMAYIDELRNQSRKSQRGRSAMSSFFRRNDNSDDENPPPSNCRGAVDIPPNRFLY